nr:hypothetical protein [Tanacetum cinerariifolium]
MIPEPGDTNWEVLVNVTFHVQDDDELTEKELKQIEADDQAIHTILLGLPEDIYATVDSCETAQEIWFTSNEGESIESYYHHFLKLMNDLKQNKHFSKKIATDYIQLYDFLKYNLKEVDELKVERLAKIQDPLALMANSNNPYAFLAPHQDQPSYNQNYMQQPMPNLEDITDLTTVINMPLALIAKAFKLNYSTLTNNNQRISSNPRNRQIAQPGNLNGYNAVQNVRNQVAQNPRVQNVRNQNGLIGVPGNGNQNVNGNLGAARAEGNAAGPNGIQLQAEEFDLMAAAADLDEIKEVNANCILMANLQQALTSGTQSDKAPVYDSDESTKYTELLEPIPEQHQAPQNDNNAISEVTSVEQSGETVEQHPANFEETRALYDSLYQNLAIEVEKVNSINRKLKETNANLTTELARFKNQEKCFEISQEKYDKLERSDESLAKHKTLELEIKHLLGAVISQDIMSVMQKTSVVDTSNLQTELEHTKECFENCIIKKENEYAKLWNDWYKKCDESKYDKISYDKAYKDMQQKIERLQAQLGDLKGKSKDTSCVSDTLNPLSQKLKNENVELEFQILNYARENAHLKTTYKNLFDSISVSRTQTKTIIVSLQNQLHNSIYENAKFRA